MLTKASVVAGLLRVLLREDQSYNRAIHQARSCEQYERLWHTVFPSLMDKTINESMSFPLLLFELAVNPHHSSCFNTIRSEGYLGQRRKPKWYLNAERQSRCATNAEKKAKQSKNLTSWSTFHFNISTSFRCF